ncbi:UNVERIFIED_CONTAM: hypothetical protein GTU68_001410, partial [Idotea baltica]|nr:hypothetical protein [Idotea baltica]
MDRSSNEYTLDKHVDSFHLGAHSNDKLIGIASCFQELFSDLPMANCYRLRGMAIDTAFQNQSIGSQLIDYTFNLLNIRQSPILWCNARESAMGYYKKLGF